MNNPPRTYSCAGNFHLQSLIRFPGSVPSIYNFNIWLSES